MTPGGTPSERSRWKEALAPTPECVPLERFAGSLTGPEMAHVASCPRCQSEMVLFRSFEESAPSEDEGAAVAWVERELLRRQSQAPRSRSLWWKLWQPPSVYRLSGALAALVLATGITVFVVRQRAPFSGSSPAGGTVYRSASVQPVAPLGDLDQVPRVLSWQAAPGASRYAVDIMEVDRNRLWQQETNGLSVTIPAGVRRLILPGKTLLWEVTAKNSAGETIANSGLQRFRVKTGKTGGGDL